jgi:hypothetical protein
VVNKNQNMRSLPLKELTIQDSDRKIDS